jgi:hypothetical protein
MVNNLENRAREGQKKNSSIDLLNGVDDASKYYGKYVALASFNNRKIVTYGENPCRVLKKARSKGIENPVIFFVPDPNITYIYAIA